MAEKVTLKVSAAAAPFIGADKPRQERMKAAAGEVKLPPTDFVSLLYYLCHDPDAEVKGRAMATLRSLDVRFISHLLADRELHPRILDALVQLHGNKPQLASLLATHPMLSEKAARFLAGQRGSAAASHAAPPPVAAAQSESAGKGEQAKPEAAAGEDGAAAAAAGPDEEEPIDESAEEYLSKYQMAQTMGVGEKIKAALTGDKEWRSILIKDANKLVSGSVIKNPRITENEVLGIAKSTVQNEEIMRVIVANKEWVKNPSIRKALIMNHKTPLTAALRFVPTLSEKELSLLAKSRNVNSVIAAQARRILLTKKDR